MKTKEQARTMLVELFGNYELMQDLKAVQGFHWEDLLADIIIAEIYDDDGQCLYTRDKPHNED